MSMPKLADQDRLNGLGYTFDIQLGLYEKFADVYRHSSGHEHDLNTEIEIAWERKLNAICASGERYNPDTPVGQVS